jgi:VanZ family protein
MVVPEAGTKQSPSQSKQKRITPRRCLAVAFVFFALMVAIGAIPGEATALSATVPDKLLHFTAYASLTCLIYAGLTGRPLSRAMRTLLAIALLGGLDEAIQSFMPYRSADWADWEFDMLAALSCVVVLALLHTLREANARPSNGS